jgi:hypothetical protein
MSQKTSRAFGGAPRGDLFVALYGLECSAVLIAMAMYKKGERPLLAFLTTHSGAALVVGMLALTTSTFVILRLAGARGGGGERQFAPTVFLNLGSVILVLATAEVVIRVSAVSTPAGPEFGNTLLVLRSWGETAARGRAMVERASTHGSYLVYDKELGWTVGPSRRSKDYNSELARQLLSRLRRHNPRATGGDQAELPGEGVESDDGIYVSSVEGIRSPRMGMAFASVPAKRRIAIVGDSFTFGLEVRYEETWGHQLERALGSEVQVLNFGVDGYGVDQADLRYERDALSWRPDVVILGVINDDLRRTMGVYAFLSFPGGEIPFSKPRFVVRGDGLALLNVPLPTPGTIFAKGSITELPFVEHDASYRRDEWEWHVYDSLYSVRFLLSRFPRWPVAGPTVSDEALRSVNGELLRRFARLAREQGSTPIIVYFPTRTDFMREASGGVSVAREVLRAYRLPYVDMTACVSAVNPAKRFVRLHYSRATNSAIAGCLRESIQGGLPGW